MCESRSAGRFRIDFRQYVEGENVDGSFRVRIVPDPDRYEHVVRSGRGYFVDRFSNLMFDETQVFEMLIEALKTLPLRFEPAEIDEPDKYVLSRIPAIEALLRGEGQPKGIASASHLDLVSRLGEVRGFAVVALDLRNHLYFANIAPERLSSINTTVKHEIGLVAELHRGHLWSTSASSLSLFFPAPNLITKTDLALGFATAARDLICVINEQLGRTGIEPLEYRFGIEAGDAQATIAGLDEAHTQVELVGVAVASAEEIARHTPAGRIWIGPRAAEACHVSWRKLMSDRVPQPPIRLVDEFGQVGIIRELDENAHGTGPLLHDT